MTKLLVCLLSLVLLSSCGRTQNEEYKDENVAYENYSRDPDVNGEEPDETVPGQVLQYNNYFVSLEIDTEERIVYGILRVNFTNRSGVLLETVVLRTFLNAFSEGFLPRPYFAEHETRVFRNGKNFGYMYIQYVSMDGEPLEYIHDGTVLTLSLMEPIDPGGTVQIALQFYAAIPRIAHLTGSNDYAMWFGMFLPLLAVFGENGWHTEDFFPAGNPFILETASFHVEIITPIRYTVVGTGLRSEEIIEDTDVKITTFAAHQVRDFSFALSNYFNHTRISTKSGIDIHFYYFTKGIAADDVLRIAAVGMEHFEERIGTFPFHHITIIETDISLEHASLSQVVFVDTIPMRQSLWNGLVHALGNQWLANIIGTNRVLYPWLTEGLTRFVSADVVHESRQAFGEFIQRQYESLLPYDNLYLASPLGDFGTWRHYAFTHGRKAMLMVYSLYNRMGSDVFWNFLNEYYYAFSFGIASGSDFFRLAEEVYGESLQDFFVLWFGCGTVPKLGD